MRATALGPLSVHPRVARGGGLGRAFATSGGRGPWSRRRRRLGLPGRRRVARVVVEVHDEVLGLVANAALLHLLGGAAAALAVEAAPVVAPAPRTYTLASDRLAAVAMLGSCGGSSATLTW